MQAPLPQKGKMFQVKIVSGLLNTIHNGNRTVWSPVQSVIIRMINKIRLPLCGRPILLVTHMITDQIGRHEFLLPIKMCERKRRKSNGEGTENRFIFEIRKQELIQV